MRKAKKTKEPLILERTAWGKPVKPGLYVQRTAENNSWSYNVVRIIFCDDGGGLRYSALDETTREKYNPIIVCQSTYQKIEE